MCLCLYFKFTMKIKSTQIKYVAQLFIRMQLQSTDWSVSYVWPITIRWESFWSVSVLAFLQKNLQ